MECQVNSMTALANNEFTVAGELAASVVQSGPAPCFLSKEAFGYIVDGIDSVDLLQQKIGFACTVLGS